MNRFPKLARAAALAAAFSFFLPALAAAQANDPAPGVTPPSSAPTELPPPPPPPVGAPAPLPPQAQAPAPAPRPPPGSWVYAQQYGWLWMPYDASYSYVPPSGAGEPLAYVYYPAFGWRWVAAPWVWGVGPWPSFGARGPRPFSWYGRGYWRTPNRWRYTPAPLRGDPVVHQRGVREAPVRAVRRDRARGREREHGERR